MSAQSESLRRAADEARRRAEEFQDAAVPKARDHKVAYRALQRLRQIGFSDFRSAVLVADSLDAVARAVDRLPEHTQSPQAMSIRASALALADYINREAR